MDPVSTTASVLTLLATIQTAKECMEKIRRSLGAEGLVLELLNEASDFRVLLANVEALNETVSFSAQTQSAVHESLLRATKAFNLFLAFVTQKLFIKTEVADRALKSPDWEGRTESRSELPGARVSKRAWFIHEKEAVKHRDSLRQTRESLYFALTVANTGIHMSLRKVIWSSQVSLQTELAAHSKAVDQIRFIVQQMADQSAIRPRSPSASSDMTVRPGSPGNMLVECPTSPPPYEEDLKKEAVCFQTTLSTTRCPKSCSCACHSTALLKSPRWINQVTGLLFMRYSGTPLLNSMKCSKQRCKERHQSKINASYYFPSWMLHRMVEVVAKWDANAAPKMNLRVMQVIPDGSPLFSYSMEGNTAGIRDLFLQNLASPSDIRDSDGRSALHIAIYYGHVSTAQFLLDQKADRDYKDKYFQSAVGACWEILFQKLAIPVIDPCVIGGPTEYSEFVDERCFTSIHKIVLGISGVSLDDYLSLSTAEINKKDIMGKTPLHLAAVRGDLEAVSTLLRYDADPNLTNDALWTPLHEAAISCNHETFRPLLTAGAHVDALNNRGQTALLLAAYVRDDPRYIDSLVGFNTNVLLVDNFGLTALHRASIRNRIKSARRLVALGADIDALDNKWLSPLHTCVLNNSHDVLKMLLDAGARADRSVTNGRTLLHDAAAVGDERTIALLSNSLLSLDGLDPDAVDADGRTAEEIFSYERQACVSESVAGALAFQILLDRLRDRVRINLLAGKFLEKLEMQSTVSDDEFFEAIGLMESSIESLHTATTKKMTTAESDEADGHLTSLWR